ncbi:MAG: M15 family metallopeptidase [Ruminococcaceae bacterium]|nr:M15 family metallopeptidase [Oscillospiraceae bacterium]
MRKFLALLLFLLPTTVYASDLSSWAKEDYAAASEHGLLPFTVAVNNLQEEITREEFCELAVRLYAGLSGETLSEPDIYPFEDSDSIVMAQAYQLGIIAGKNNNMADPLGSITRQELAKMLVNTLKVADIPLKRDLSFETATKSFHDASEVAPWATTDIATALHYGFISGFSETQLAPLFGATREQAVAIINRTYQKFSKSQSTYELPRILSHTADSILNADLNLSWTPIPEALEYSIIIKDGNFFPFTMTATENTEITIDTSDFKTGGAYTAIVGVSYPDGSESFSIPLDFHYLYRTKMTSKPRTEKELRVFPEGDAFTTKEQADAYMVEVTVDVWNMKSDGTKYPAKRTICVNSALAEDVKEIFRIIYEHPSQFPIKSVGGYSWRNTALGKVSQHSYGTCIDINPDENYYCYTNGTAITGSHWLPGEDPYSITPDGIVVSAFAEYGWDWGGNWNNGRNSVIDYMHFTFLGK